MPYPPALMSVTPMAMPDELEPVSARTPFPLVVEINPDAVIEDRPTPLCVDRMPLRLPLTPATLMTWPVEAESETALTPLPFVPVTSAVEVTCPPVVPQS